MILLEGVSAAVSIRNGKLAVRAGGKVANALTVLEALENNTLQRFTGILVNLGDGNVLLHHIGNSEESRVLGIVFDGEYLFIQHILRVGDDLLRLISARLCIRKPDTTICAGGVVAEQLAVLVDGKGYALNRLVGFTVDFQNTEMLLDGIGKGQGRNFSLILNQLDRLLTGIHVIVLSIAAGFFDAISAGLQVLDHRFAVLVGRYRSQMRIIVINIKLPAGQRNLGFLVDFHNANRQLLGVRNVDLADELRRVGRRVDVDFVHLLVAEITLRRFGFDYLIKSLGQIVQTGIAVYIGLYGCKHLTVAAHLESRSGKRHLGVLIVLVDFNARSRSVLERQLNVLAVVPRKGLNVRTIGSVSLRCSNLVHLKGTVRQVASLNGELAQSISGVGVLEVVVDTANLKGCAHQVATIGGRNLVNLKGVIVRVGELQLDRLTALGAGLYGFSREQGVTLRCCGFLNGYGGVQRQVLKVCFTVAVGIFAFGLNFSSIGIGNLESTALQRCTVLIGFQHFKSCFFLEGGSTERQLIAGQLDRRLNQNDRLNTRAVGRCNIDIVTVNIHAG